MIVHKDLAPERQDHLEEIIRRESAVRVDDLSRELGVSPATIRRDLEVLETQGRIRRVHGGAVSVENRHAEPLFDDKTAIAAKEKLDIAQHAASLIQSNDTIYLDGGSTVLELARLVRGMNDITVVTNSLRAAIELSGSGPEVIIVGGSLRRRSQTVIGNLTRLTLEQLHVDKAFLGTIGLSLNEGMTTTDTSEAFTKQLVIERTDQVILLADSSKAGNVSFAQAGGLDDIDLVITDTGLDSSFLKGLKEKQINVVTV